MKCNVTNVYEISHIWELRKWNQVKNVPCSCERNVSLKKKRKRKNGISLKSWIFFRLLTQLHKLTLQLRGLFFTWMKCKSLKWCPLICFSDRTKKSFDTLISDTLPTAFFLSVGNVPASVRTKMKNKKKKKRKHKMLFSWFTILFMARFMDLWWNKSQISEMRYWNIFLVFVSIHCVTWSIVTKKTDRILIMVKRVLLFSNQKKTAVWQRQLLRRWENGITPREKPFGEEERKKVN